MKGLWTIPAAFLLCGCSAFDFLSNSEGVGTPSPATLAEFVKETGASGITVRQYLIASIAYTNEKCHEFFDLLEKYKQDSSLLDKVVTAGVAAGSPILALSHSGKTVGQVAGAVLFANQINKFSGEIYAFGAYKEQLKTHVFSGMNAVQRAKGLDLFQMHQVGLVVLASDDKCLPREIEVGDKRTKWFVDRCRLEKFAASRQAEDLMIARSIAAEYAAQCSLANMRRIVTAALEQTETRLPQAAPGGGSSGSPIASSAIPQTVAKSAPPQ